MEIRYSINCWICSFALLGIFTWNKGFGQLKEIQNNNEGVLTLRIDPTNASGGNASDIFEDIKYIPLETTSESQFSNISQFDIFNGRYIILDHATNCILIFKEDGKFLSKIKGKRNTIIHKFVINKWLGEIGYIDNTFQILTICDIDGKFIRQQDISDIKILGIFNSNFAYLGPDVVVSYDPYRDIKKGSKYFQPYSRALIRYAKSNASVLATGFHYGEEEAKIDVVSPPTSPLTNYGIDTAYFFVKPYSFNIYTITPNTINYSYHLAFPANIALPSDFLTNKLYTGKREEFIKTHPNQIFSLNNCYKINDNLLFKAATYYSNNEDNLILNLKSGNLIAYKHILPDAKSFYLPLFDNTNSNFDNYGLDFCDGKYSYTSLTSFAMLKAHNENKSLNAKYDSTLLNYFAKSNKDANPVILRLQLKNEL
ncbi:6-bladed beta-propeller [Chitinophaga sp. 30R24]|uniref:6-bladed beta-propeller n=1 Tax=Chitinophaga sp. 30R24 TaxID=3248838 RepID=UPI003B8FB8C1